MPGVFDAPYEEEFYLDRLLTAAEIERAGNELLEWLAAVATQTDGP